MTDVKKPCIGCQYYKACGSTNRTMPCEGRMTKTDKKKADIEAEMSSQGERKE